MAPATDQKLQRVADVYYQRVDEDSAVMLSVQSGSYFGTNAVGARVCELLEAPRTIAEMTALVMQEFDVDEATCSAALVALLEKMLDHGIVEVTKP